MASRSEFLVFLLTLVVLMSIILYNNFLSASFRRALLAKNLKTHLEDDVCNNQFKNSHYMYLDVRPGRTGSSLLQVISLLAISKAHCFTPVLNPNSRYLKYIEMYFDLNDIKKVALNNSGFRVLNKQRIGRSGAFLSREYNWTLECTCYGYKFSEDQIKYAISMIRLKTDVMNEARTFVSETIGNRPLVAVHVRLTDKTHVTNVSWYEEYVKRAMVIFDNLVPNITFVFLSDDIEWCKARYSGENVYFSPFLNAGADLALISMCKYSILTVGCYGFTGAWFGQHHTVIYNRRHALMDYKSVQFFFPNWIQLE